MKKIFKYLLILICSVLFFISCSNNGFFDPEEVFITLNIYNNVDDRVSQITYSKNMKDNFHNDMTLNFFNCETKKEGYLFFGGYSERNGKGKQYINLKNVINVESYTNKQYWSYDIYLHYEKVDEDSITEVKYVLPEDCYIDGELPTQFVIGETYTLPTVYVDEHSFDGWEYKAVYDEFISQDFSIYPNNDNLFTWLNNYSYIEATPLLYPYENRFYIDSPQDLVNIKNHPKGEIIFVNDIDMKGVNYTPFAFSGTIQGNDHIISNLSITTTDTNAGLFTTNSGKIEDLILKNITINSLNEKASYIGALAGTSSGSIYGVSVGGTINSEMGVVGGVVGKMTGKDFVGCSSSLTINSGNDTSSYVGGVVGRLENTKITFCYFTGNINAPSTTVGGVVGSCVNANMEYCYNYGTVTATGSNVGGVVGHANGVKMWLCQNEGVVTGCNSVGGIVGYMDNSSISEITNMGEVNGYDNVGGIIGKLDSTTYTQRKFEILKNEGNVISVGNNVGGIVGNLDNEGSTFIFDYITNIGSVEATGDNVGGIIGRIKNYIGFNDEDVRVHKFTNCTNEGSVKGKNNVGGFNGYMHFSASNPYGRHPGVKIEMDTISNTGDILGTSYVGGLIGNGTSQDGKGSVIKNSTSSSKVEATHTIGGIAGYLNFITVDSCSNKDSILIASGSYSNETGTETFVRFGGYCGVGSEIKNCTNELDLLYIGTGSCIGGLVGQGNGNLTSCINKGNIVATEASKVGGIAGYIKVDREYKASNLVNEGDVEAKSYVGGVIGEFFEEILALKDNETHTSTFDEIVNYGELRVGVDYSGVIGSVYGNATNEYLRFPTVKIAITNIKNYGEIQLLRYPYFNVGALVGYIETDSEDSYVDRYVINCNINSGIAYEEHAIGNNVNARLGVGSYYPKS